MRPVGLVAAMVILLGGGAGNYFRYVERLPEHGPDFSRIPYRAGEYDGEERRFSDASYQILQADTSTLRIYHDRAGHRYSLFSAYFASQRYGSQVHSPKHCLPGGGWRIRSLEPFPVELPDRGRHIVNRLIIELEQRRQVMFYWFETRGGILRTEFGLKLDLMRNALLFRPTDVAFVRVTTDVEPGETLEAATERALRLIARFSPAIESALPFGGQRG